MCFNTLVCQTIHQLSCQNEGLKIFLQKITRTILINSTILPLQKLLENFYQYVYMGRKKLPLIQCRRCRPDIQFNKNKKLLKMENLKITITNVKTVERNNCKHVNDEYKILSLSRISFL